MNAGAARRGRFATMGRSDAKWLHQCFVRRGEFGPARILLRAMLWGRVRLHAQCRDCAVVEHTLQWIRPGAVRIVGNRATLDIGQ